MIEDFKSLDDMNLDPDSHGQAASYVWGTIATHEPLDLSPKHRVRGIIRSVHAASNFYELLNSHDIHEEGSQFCD